MRAQQTANCGLTSGNCGQPTSVVHQPTVAVGPSTLVGLHFFIHSFHFHSYLQENSRPLRNALGKPAAIACARSQARNECQTSSELAVLLPVSIQVKTGQLRKALVAHHKQRRPLCEEVYALATTTLERMCCALPHIVHRTAPDDTAATCVRAVQVLRRRVGFGCRMFGKPFRYRRMRAAGDGGRGSVAPELTRSAR